MLMPEVAKQDAWEEKKSTVSPICEPHKLQWQTDRQDVLAGAIVA